MVLRFQRKNMIESSSSSGDSDTYNMFDQMNMMESKNPMVRLVVFGKMKNIISTFKKDKLNDTDRKALRGLFIKRLKDYDEQ
jgi:hypothetical protein